MKLTQDKIEIVSRSVCIKTSKQLKKIFIEGRCYAQRVLESKFWQTFEGDDSNPGIEKQRTVHNLPDEAKQC